jgi:hypothetical protein
MSDWSLGTLASFAGLGIVALLLLRAVAGTGRPSVPYKSAGPLLSAAEANFLAALDTVAPPYRVFVKVRLADLIAVKPGLDRSRQTAALNRVASKHLDFVLMDSSSRNVVCAIELDDSSHNRSDRRQRDEFVDRACQAAGVALVRVKATRSYDRSALKAQISGALASSTTSILHAG